MRHFLESQTIKVISKRENGSGVIEIPIMATTTGDNDLITVEMMSEIVTNFSSFSLVPVGVAPHREFNDRGGFSLAFIESIDLRGDKLFARVDLTAPLFTEVVVDGGWRGFSVEIAHNLKTQAKNIEGWVLTGGVFTNRPAVDAHFKIAASSRANAEQTGTFDVPITLPEGKQGVHMDTKTTPTGEVSKSFHDEKIKAEQDKTVALTAERADLAGRLDVANDEIKRLRLGSEEAATTASDAVTDKLQAEAKTLRLEGEVRQLKDSNRNLRADVTELETKHQDELKVNLSAKVIAIRDAALEAGVPPRMFEGCDADPAGWMQASFATVEAFETHYKNLSGVSRDLVSEPAKSGDAPSKGSEQTNLTSEELTRMERMGLDPKYVGIKTEADLFEVTKEKDE